jgi:hypothetical protein
MWCRQHRHDAIALDTRLSHLHRQASTLGKLDKLRVLDYLLYVLFLHELCWLVPYLGMGSPARSAGPKMSQAWAAVFCVGLFPGLAWPNPAQPKNMLRYSWHSMIGTTTSLTGGGGGEGAFYGGGGAC